MLGTSANSDSLAVANAIAGTSCCASRESGGIRPNRYARLDVQRNESMAPELAAGFFCQQSDRRPRVFEPDPRWSRPESVRHACVSSPADRAEVASRLGAEQDLPRHRPRPVAAQALRPRHVPLSQRGRAARRPSRGVHRDRHRLPLQADARVQRPAPDGLGRLRPARRAVRRPDEHPSPDHHPGEHRQLPPPDQVARLLLRLGPRNRHDRPRLLQVDPVDLPARSTTPGTTRTSNGPTRRADARKGKGRPIAELPIPAGTSRPRRLSRFAAAGLPGRGPRQLVPGAGDGAGQRGGHRRQERARRLSRSSACR